MKLLPDIIMPSDEMYDKVMKVVEELRSSGIKVTVTPSACRDNADLIARYADRGRPDPSKWVHVTFDCDTDEQIHRVGCALGELRAQGIRFDTGGIGGTRDWELDWSFHVHGS